MSKPAKEYYVLTGSDAEELSASVSDWIESGWELVGGVCCVYLGELGGFLWSQALWRHL